MPAKSPLNEGNISEYSMATTLYIFTKSLRGVSQL